jgi:PKD repeat protein
MLGVAVDKDFATNGFIYILYVQELSPLMPDQDTPAVSKLSRLTVNPDNTLQNSSSPETVILGTDWSSPCSTPDNTRDCIPADYKWHTIGTVRSDPVDGTLWVGSGDSHGSTPDANTYRPYDETSYAGKIMHIDRNGNGLPNHPFCPQDANLTHVCTKIYAKGFRNPFRFHLRAGKGPIVGDVGNSDREEIDLIQPGRSYGWPCYEGTGRNPLLSGSARCAQEYAKEGTAAAHTPPTWDYAHDGGASITAGPMYTGSTYPADYRGDIFVGDYVQGWIKRLEIDSNDQVTAVHEFGTEWTGGVDIEQMPNGDIAYVDFGYMTEDAINRFTYAAGNGIPVARATATPTSGSAPLTVAFDGRSSSDPDGDLLTYDWDFGDGSAHSSAANPTHTYASAGTYTARLTVDDGTGRRPSTTVGIQVGGNQAPTATIDAPADESLSTGGQRIDLRGAGSDPEDGALTGASLSWEVILHHGTHIHQMLAATGSTASFTTAVDHDADSYYEIRLTATDSQGRTSTKVVDVRPQVRNLTLASSPPGAPVGYDAAAVTPAPVVKQAAVGYRATITAAESFTSGGRTYRFQSWSDGGARQHAITVPANDATLTANYALDDASATERLVFKPEADTYVDSTQPTVSFGSRSIVSVDNEPVKQAFLRFPVSGIAGRKVTGVKLRMRQTDVTTAGGHVYPLASNSWAESMTWDTRPAISGSPVASFGAVAAGNDYEVDLGAGFVTGDGRRSIAIDSSSWNGSRWATRETTTPPQLIVEVEGSPPATTGDGLSTISNVGTSDPTYFGSNRRVALTSGGRTLTVFGRSGQGIQLAWRTASGGSWQTSTTGETADGRLLWATGTGSWPASIAVARDATGAEHAWVVWGRTSAASGRTIQMRRLSDLDSPAGPRVGPVVTVDAPALGAFRPDIAFERAADGRSRGAVMWVRKAGTGSYEVVTAWFSDLTTDTPTIGDHQVLYTAPSANRAGTLVPTAGGMRAVFRGHNGAMRAFSHDATQPLTTWVGSAAGVLLGTGSSPSGVALASGAFLAAAETDTAAHVVRVQRFSALGVPGSVELELTGYAQPSVASDGINAWLVMKRLSDGFIVSREFTPTGGWSASDRVEIGAEGGGNHDWPNLLREADGRLRLVVRGPRPNSGSTTAVLAYQRTVGAGDASAPVLTTTALSSATLESGAFTPLARRFVAFRLSEPAQVHLRLERRRKASRCRSKARSRRCASRIGRRVSVRGRKGRNVVSLRKLVGTDRVPAGRYRLVLVAVDAAGNRSSAVVRLRVRG